MITSTNLSPTIGNWLKDSSGALNDIGIESAYLDSLILLENVLNTDRSNILSNQDHSIPSDALSKLQKLLTKRLGDEPIAYLVNQKEFYGRNFYVDQRVMIPRPESEAFINLLKELSPKSLIDIGTGSGCIGITTKLEMPICKILLADTSDLALDVSRFNAKNLDANVLAVKSHLLNSVRGRFETITANLPYLPNNFKLEGPLSYEPRMALRGGIDGLDLFRKLFRQLSGFTTKYLLTESLEIQHKKMKLIAKQAGFSHIKTSGLVQLYKKA